MISEVLKEHDRKLLEQGFSKKGVLKERENVLISYEKILLIMLIKREVGLNSNEE